MRAAPAQWNEPGYGARCSIATSSRNKAPSCIAGYCVCHDVSERTFQLEGTDQWTKGKGCPTFGPVGPWLVTPDVVRLGIEKLGEQQQTCIAFSA